MYAGHVQNALHLTDEQHTIIIHMYAHAIIIHYMFNRAYIATCVAVLAKMLHALCYMYSTTWSD